MTSLRKRFEQGDFSELFIRFWHEFKGQTPLCCYVVETKDSIWKIKCDSSEWLTIEEFKRHCLNCQSIIDGMVKKWEKNLHEVNEK